jgi:LCP family protein required for cell wall assembly
LKKKISIEEIESSVKPEGFVEGVGHKKDNDKSSSKTPIKFKKNRSKKQKIRRAIILSILAVIIGLICWFGYVSYSSMKNIFGGDAPNLLDLLDGRQLKGESSGRVNVLLLGVGDKGHSGEGLSDTIMVVSYDVKSKQVAMISVPRDLYVKVADYGYTKINGAHAYGEYYKYPGGGPALAKETVSKVLNLPIHYYARVDFTGFKDLVNAVGGVDINVSEDLYDPYYPGGSVYIKKGQKHMDGEMALKYARSRETTSDFDRARRQQEVLVAVREKILSSQTLLNPKKIADIIKVLGDHIKTDFEISEIGRGIELFKGINTGSIINKVFDNGADGLLDSYYTPEAGSALIPRLGIGNYKELQAAANNIFNDKSIESENAKIIIKNGTTRSGLAGRVAEQFKLLKYNVVDVSSADSTTYQTTQLVDYTNGAKSATLSTLEKELKVTAIKKTASNSSYDFEIILGKSYEEN